jgi:hypothetical protein
MPNTFTLIQAVTVTGATAASIDFTSIPSTYTDLFVKFSLRASTAGVDQQARININGTGIGSNFLIKVLQGAGSGTPSGSSSTTGWFVGGTIPGSGATANTFSNIDLYLPNYTVSANKSMSIDAVGENNATLAYAELNAASYSNTATISSLTFTIPSGSFVQYSTAYLYGIVKS